MHTRKDYFQLDCAINTRRLYPTSRLVSHVTGIQVQRNKAVVGQNAFAHEAGIHQDGMLKERSTYEIMNPEDVGLPRTELVLGKHSGRAALRQRVQDLGYHLDDPQLEGPGTAAARRSSRRSPTGTAATPAPTRASTARTMRSGSGWPGTRCPRTARCSTRRGIDAAVLDAIDKNAKGSGGPGHRGGESRSRARATFDPAVTNVWADGGHAWRN